VCHQENATGVKEHVAGPDQYIPYKLAVKRVLPAVEHPNSAKVEVSDPACNVPRKIRLDDIMLEKMNEHRRREKIHGRSGG
jgi:hypothetical protein